MKCPHCNEGVHDSRTHSWLGEDGSAELFVYHMQCPECDQQFVYLFKSSSSDPYGNPIGARYDEVMVWPREGSRPPAHSDVPDAFAADYNEACQVLGLSPKASAALSRRCLQHLLREEGGVKPGRLSDEIQEAIDEGSLPTHITASLDCLREIGNFAAHPTKDKQTGEVLKVEPGEADWTLDTVESLFDFYFVMPAKAAARKAALNEKLKAAGRKEIS